jgi:hypothetical protein
MMAGRQYRGRDFWTETIAEFEATGGMDRREFARLKGLSYSTLNDWVYRLRREQTQRELEDGAQHEGIRFVELRLESLPAASGSGAMVLELAGARVHFEHVPGPDWLAQFFTRMQASGRGGTC